MRGRTLRLTLVVLALAGVLSLVLPQLTHLPARAAGDDEYRRMRLLTEVLHQIQKKYVEDKKADELLVQAVKGMVSSLDPHSAYLTPQEYKELQIETKGQFSGVGIVITMRDGILTVVSPIEGTPAYKAGVEAADRIIKINGKLTKGMTLMDAVKAIRGPKGSKVTLTILREGLGKLKDIDIMRDVIPLKSVRYYRLEPGYGLVRVTNFQEDTTEDLIKALKELQSQKPPLKGLILDLRTNPGGLLTEAVNVADLFLKEGVIVSTKGREPEQEMTFKATRRTVAGDYPLIVLVNQGSASASEIVAGALQDHKRAVLLGMPTFGKGSVQTILPLEDLGALKLTTARYYTPSGKAIQAKGIKPDVEVPWVEPPKAKKVADQSRPQSLREKDLPGAMPAEEVTAPAAEPAVKAKPPKDGKPNDIQYPKDRLTRDNQMMRALDLLKALQVFAGQTPPKAPAAK
ncbi:MAG: S41 family peptidase [Desulfarculus sp.]|nr:MAG: S41 family peptidase [Desulfarculus sp.]